MQKEQQQLAALIKGKKVAFIGAGVSHKALIKEFVELGAHVTLCDQKKSVDDFGDYAATIRELGIDLSLGENYLEGFKGQDIIMRTPGFVGYFEKPLQDAMAAGTMVTSEVELFFDFCPCEIVGVTGSDGKTTTTTLISEILKQAGRTVWVGGNIGRPLLPLAGRMACGDAAVVELSSFQLLDMKRSPHVAVITNLAPNHLDVHKDMEEYVSAKENVYLHQSAGDVVVLNADNPITGSFAAKAPGHVLEFSRRSRPAAGVCLENGVIYRTGDAPGAILKQSEIMIPGIHNVENYMAAICAVEGLASDDDIRAVARTFGGVEHRIELVRVKDGVSYYNDSIASSPSRTIAGLRSFDRKIILIAGGYDKQIPYDALGPEIVEHVKILVLTGATSEKIKKAVKAAPSYNPDALQIVEFGDFYEAIRAASGLAGPGDVVMLSPASASFDHFRNFMVRGDAFKKTVMEL